MPDIRIMPLLLLAATLPLSAIADEGVLEINQACAEGNGCFDGDSPGLPVEITQPGSYVLTSSLTVPPVTDGIRITADRVALDLNGFSVTGPVTCTGVPVTSCSAQNGVSGIHSSGQAETTVRDGFVSGFGNKGVFLGERASVINVKTSENGEEGLFLGDQANLRDVVAHKNGYMGIVMGAGSTLENAKVTGNLYRGINAGEASSIRDSAFMDNGDIGLFAGFSSSVRNVSVVDNQDDGIMLFNGGSILSDSTVRGNAGLGVNCLNGGDSGLRNVVLAGNNSGSDQFGGSCEQLATNLCQNSTTCP
jgi:hypothetical protein